MALHLPIGPLKPAVGWSRYQDANPVSTSPLANDLATVPLEPVVQMLCLSRQLLHLSPCVCGNLTVVQG